MSLRAARSLPCLRTALKQSLKTPAVGGSFMTLLQPFPKSSLALQFSTTQYLNGAKKSTTLSSLKTSTRNVHQTTQKKSPTLLNSNDNKYATMNLQALKTECRSRGLKVSGNKKELLQRLTTSDLSGMPGARSIATTPTLKKVKEVPKTTTRNISNTKTVPKPKKMKSTMEFSTTVKKQAKGDSLTVDSLTFPAAEHAPAPESEISAPSFLSKDPVKQIDIVETKTKIADMEGAVSVGEDNTGEVSKSQNMFKKFLIDEAAGTVPELETLEQKFEPSKDDVNSKDKLFFGGLFAGVVAWWSIKPKSKK